MKVFSRQIYSYNFHICKLNNLKVIDNLYSQCLTQILSKTSSFIVTEGVITWPLIHIHFAACVAQRKGPPPFLNSKRPPTFHPVLAPDLLLAPVKVAGFQWPGHVLASARPNAVADGNGIVISFLLSTSGSESHVNRIEGHHHAPCMRVDAPLIVWSGCMWIYKDTYIVGSV